MNSSGVPNAPLLSIRIPTYNRKKYLDNCLDAIVKSVDNFGCAVEISVSDNHSTDGTELVLLKYSKILNLKVSRNSVNLGSSANIIKVVSMATGYYVWIIGDDDLVLPDAIRYFSELTKKNSDKDFFFINAYSLDRQRAPDQIGGIDLNSIPKEINKFSSLESSFACTFLDLIDPKISFDFLGGIYLSIFRRDLWSENSNLINVEDLIKYSHLEIFETTFPHIKIFASAFKNSCAFFVHKPLLVSLSGVQEWAPSWPLVKSVRIVESLGYYRIAGMNIFKYLNCMNFAHNTFMSDYIKMILNPVVTGGNYANLLKSFVVAIFFPSFYTSIFNMIRRFAKNKIKFKKY